MIRNGILGLLTAALFVTGQARAGYLNSYNLIVTGNLNSTSEVEGRTIVGGNLGGSSSNYAVKLDGNANKNVDTLIVGGNITSSGQVNMQAGVLRLGGSITGAGVNFNNGSSLVHDSGAALIAQAAATEMATTSAALAALKSNSTVSLPNGSPGPVVFNAAPDAKGVAVFTIDGAIFSNGNVQQYQLNRNGATSIVINVTGTNITFNQGNFVGDMATSFFSANAIWNFSQATSLNIQNHLYGAVLAPLATLSNNTSIEGSVFVKNFNQNGEVHLPNYAGSIVVVPEPPSAVLTSLGLILPGVWAVAFGRRRARAASVA